MSCEKKRRINFILQFCLTPRRDKILVAFDGILNRPVWTKWNIGWANIKSLRDYFLLDEISTDIQSLRDFNFFQFFDGVFNVDGLNCQEVLSCNRSNVLVSNPEITKNCLKFRRLWIKFCNLLLFHSITAIFCCFEI